MLPHLRFLFSFAGKSYSLKIFSQSQKGAQLCIFFVYRFHSGSKFFHEQLLIQLHAPMLLKKSLTDASLLFLLLLCRGLGSEVSAVHYPDHFQLLPVHHCSSMFQMLLFYFSLPEQSLSIFYELNCKKRKGSVPFP